MGLLSKIKNTLTGGWAEVFIDSEDGKRGESLTYTVRCVVGKEPIKISRVYIQFEARESIEIPNYRVGNSGGSGAGSDYRHITASEVLLEKEDTVADAQELKAGESYSWEGSVEIPDHLPGTFNGKYAAIEWRIIAGLDMTGNDPDSGWQAVHVH